MEKALAIFVSSSEKKNKTDRLLSKIGLKKYHNLDSRVHKIWLVRRVRIPIVTILPKYEDDL